MWGLSRHEFFWIVDVWRMSYNLDDEVREFVIPRRDIRRIHIRVPIRIKEPLPKPIMEIGEPDPVFSSQMQKLRANLEWWDQNYDQIIHNESLYGRHVAISDGEIFSADSI